jgi:KaiC/GvpD/RAD55 family RecA-like ATPase
MIEILRPVLVDSLERMASGGHLLVVGEPGAGKSWLLKSFVGNRKNAGDSVVFLRAEDHVVNSLEELFRSIGTKDFIAALRAFSGNKKYLVIDSLDALRAEPSQRAFRDLIRLVQRTVPEFHVVASMRTFDSRQSIEFQRLFPGSDSTTDDSVPIVARHLLVPVFSDDELKEVQLLDPRLIPVLSSASTAGQTLLHNPFNLWLVIHLLDAEISVDWLSSIQSEVQLLDQYWHFRIGSRANMGPRTKLLTRLTEHMVHSNTLSVSLRDISGDLGTDNALKDLLSDEILFKTESNRLLFTHNILFDYALAYFLLTKQISLLFLRLLLRGAYSTDRASPIF